MPLLQSSSTRLAGTTLGTSYVFLTGIVALVMTGCASSTKTVLHQEATGIRFSEERPLTIQADNHKTAAFIGYADKDSMSSQMGAGLLYPGDTAGVLLASVAAHAVTAGALQDSAESKLQAEANSVLKDYLEYISDIEEGEIVSKVIKQLDAKQSYAFSISAYSDGVQQKSWVARIRPTYIMAQDQRQILLRTEILLGKSEARDIVEYQNVVDVVSSATRSTDPKQFWLQQDELREIAEELLNLSLEWMITDIMTGQNDAATDQKTFQYEFGGEQFYERGNLLAQDCSFTVMRNLRGWIKVFPSSAATDCKNSPHNSDHAYEREGASP